MNMVEFFAPHQERAVTHLDKEKTMASVLTSLPLQDPRWAWASTLALPCPTHPHRAESHRGSSEGGVQRDDKVGEGSELCPTAGAAPGPR